jgi:hypothetical protein
MERLCAGAALAVLVAATGCNDPTFLSERRPLETQMGMNGYTSDSDLYVLPVRMPTDAERRALMTEQQRDMLPMPVPWAGLRDFDIEIEWSVKNLEHTPQKAYFTINGGDEFGDYQPMLYLDPTVNAADQTPPPPIFVAAPLDLAADEVQVGQFREDQLAEAAHDLEAIIRYPDPMNVRATPYEVLVHDSTVSQIGLENVPAADVTPAMVRFALNISSQGHVAADYTVRVRDHNNKLASPTAMNLYVPTATTLPPVVAPPGMAAPPTN